MPSRPANRWSRAAALLLMLYWGALAMGTHLPAVPGPPLHYNDKLAHFAAYAGLAFLLAFHWTTRRDFLPGGLLFAFLVTTGYGVLDELTQLLVPNRMGDWRDWLADTAGAATGTGLFWMLETLRRGLGREGRTAGAP